MITLEDFRNLDSEELLAIAIGARLPADRLAAVEAAHAKLLEEMGHGAG